MLSDTAGTPIIIEGRKVLYFLCVVPFRASVGFDASVIAWHADENHFQLYNVLHFVGWGWINEEAIFEGEMKAKEGINSVNRCNEVGRCGRCGTNVEDLNSKN